MVTETPIEVPDWYRAVALVGVDSNGDPTVVLLDSTGAIMAVMKGEEDGTLRNIKVDSAGRMIAVIRDPTSDNYIAIDSDGFITAVLKGIFSGTLKTIKVDTDGRMEMIPVDPADIWGNAISMGNAELAASLGFPHRYDRRGNIVFVESFENGVSHWALSGGGTGAAFELSSTFALYGGLALKLTGGSDGSKMSTAVLDPSHPVLGKIGLELVFTVQSVLEFFEVRINLYDGTNLHQGRIRSDQVNSKIQYYSSAGAWVDLIDPLALRTGPPAYHHLKLVVDLSADKYVRCLVDDNEEDMSAIDLYAPADASAARFYMEIFGYSVAGNNGVTYVDGVIVTQSEPA